MSKSRISNFCVYRLHTEKALQKICLLIFQRSLLCLCLNFAAPERLLWESFLCLKLAMEFARGGNLEDSEALGEGELELGSMGGTKYLCRIGESTREHR